MTPAPGTYNDPRNAFESMKRVTGLKRSPFGQTSVRFEPKVHIRKNPGKIITDNLLRKCPLFH
jgi:hypothetical protein